MTDNDTVLGRIDALEILVAELQERPKAASS